MEQTALTPEGKAKIEAELKRRLEVERPQITKDIAEARAHGDLSENSEYHDARERQSMNEGLISHLQAQLASSVVIDVTKKEPAEGEDRKVLFGCTVILVEYDEDGEEIECTDERGEPILNEEGYPEVETALKLVGVHEVDMASNKISYKSPIGKGLIGRLEGDTVEIKVPTGTRTFEIVQVLYI